MKGLIDSIAAATSADELKMPLHFAFIPLFKILENANKKNKAIH